MAPTSRLPIPLRWCAMSVTRGLLNLIDCGQL
jgi:hypothetical protein